MFLCCSEQERKMKAWRLQRHSLQSSYQGTSYLLGDIGKQHFFFGVFEVALGLSQQQRSQHSSPLLYESGPPTPIILLDQRESAYEQLGMDMGEGDILWLQEMGKELSAEQVEQLKAKRKEQKKRQKENKREVAKQREAIRERLEQAKQEEITTPEPVDVIEENQNILTGKYYDYFKGVFEKHQERARKYYEQLDEEEGNEDKEEKGEGESEQAEGAGAAAKGQEKMSRSMRKKMRWLKVADLKARAKRPDLVEAWDITAPDPLFLCELKTLKNTIPVPRHWNQKSKFLQTKRGILKPMFKLPEFIQATGISKLRDPFSERDGQKMVREKLKERMNPKLGKIDIEYSVLHDAFFKYQTKSELTVFGDTYYEGKEDESKARQFKPGLVSEALRMALGISDYQAPPWIINMQRYGAPPSYPTLRILGSNIPFSQVASYSIINKQGLEEVARKLGQPGLYATFRTYYEQEEEEFVDKGYWGQITNLDEIHDDMEEEWQQDQQEEEA